MVTSPLIDVLLRFRFHRIALTTDISRMYRAVALTQSDRDQSEPLWRRDPSEPLKDYWMTRVMFGVSASSFMANMCIKQYAVDHASRYPLARKVVNESFYIDDGLTGADTIDEAVELHNQLRSVRVDFCFVSGTQASQWCCNTSSRSFVTLSQSTPNPILTWVHKDLGDCVECSLWSFSYHYLWSTPSRQTNKTFSRIWHRQDIWFIGMGLSNH